MKIDDSNREIAQFQSYQLDTNNQIAITKKSEKEKIIQPKIDFQNEKSMKEENIQDEEDQPISNYPYEFYEEPILKKDIKVEITNLLYFIYP